MKSNSFQEQWPQEDSRHMYLLQKTMPRIQTVDKQHISPQSTQSKVSTQSNYFDKLLNLQMQFAKKSDDLKDVLPEYHRNQRGLIKTFKPQQVTMNESASSQQSIDSRNKLTIEMSKYNNDLQPVKKQLSFMPLRQSIQEQQCAMNSVTQQSNKLSECYLLPRRDKQTVAKTQLATAQSMSMQDAACDLSLPSPRKSVIFNESIIEDTNEGADDSKQLYVLNNEKRESQRQTEYMIVHLLPPTIVSQPQDIDDDGNDISINKDEDLHQLQDQCQGMINTLDIKDTSDIQQSLSHEIFGAQSKITLHNRKASKSHKLVSNNQLGNQIQNAIECNSKNQLSTTNCEGVTTCYDSQAFESSQRSKYDCQTSLDNQTIPPLMSTKSQRTNSLAEQSCHSQKQLQSMGQDHQDLILTIDKGQFFEMNPEMLNPMLTSRKSYLVNSLSRVSENMNSTSLLSV